MLIQKLYLQCFLISTTPSIGRMAKVFTENDLVPQIESLLFYFHHRLCDR